MLAWDTNSWAVRVFPMPGAPASMTIRPRPDIVSVKAASKAAISRWRPTKEVPPKTRAADASVCCGRNSVKASPNRRTKHANADYGECSSGLKCGQPTRPTAVPQSSRNHLPSGFNCFACPVFRMSGRYVANPGGQRGASRRRINMSTVAVC